MKSNDIANELIAAACEAETDEEAELLLQQACEVEDNEVREG